MIDRIIEISARNRFMVFLFVAAAAHGRLVVDETHSARRHSRPQRHPGDRLLAMGPQPRHPRGPGHVSDRQRDAGRAEGEGRSRLFRLRLLVRVHHFRGRHGHLLGALAHARVSVEDPAEAAEGRGDGTRAGRHRRRLGLSVCAGGRRPAQPGRTALAAGLVPALSACRRCRAWRRSRRSAASCGSIR